MPTAKPKVVGVLFHLTRGRTHEFTAAEHGKGWKETSAEYRETNGETGHNQIIKEEPITSVDETEEDAE